MDANERVAADPGCSVCEGLGQVACVCVAPVTDGLKKADLVKRALRILIADIDLDRLRGAYGRTKEHLVDLGETAPPERERHERKAEKEARAFHRWPPSAADRSSAA